MVPKSLGTAVYKARTIFANISPGINYNDLQICNNAGVYKNGSGKGLFDDENAWLNELGDLQVAGKKFATSDLILYPNPTDEFVNIKYKIADDAFGVLIVYDMIGSLIKTIELPGNSNHLLTPVYDLPSGLYSYKFIVNNQFQSAGKLLIK